MARRRSRSETETEPTTTTDEGSTKKMAGLTAEQIAELLQKTRTKGQYVERINEFVESGEMGIAAGEQWVDFQGKNPNTLKQGFDNAKDKQGAVEGAKQVKVIKGESDVFLVNLAVAASQGLPIPEAAVEAA